MNYLVTGASGHLGQKVVRHLREYTDANSIYAGVHNMSKAHLFDNTGVHVTHLDYRDPATIRNSLTNIDILIYIPSITYNLQDRVQEFENVLSGAKQSSISDFIFVSFFADQVNNPFQMSPFYAYVPRRLSGSGLNYAYVRNTLYADPLVPYIPELIERGHIIYPVGSYPLSFISRDDSAKAIASLAVQPTMRGHGQSYLLSMENNYNMIELAKIISRVSKHQITYRPLTVEQFARVYKNDGGMELASMYAAGGKGLLADTSHAFKRLTGDHPETMDRFLIDHYHPTI